MSRRAAGQVNQGLACLREGWLSLRKPMYECRSMMNAQSKEISSSLTSATREHGQRHGHHRLDARAAVLLSGP